MATINVYEQYFKASCKANGVDRHAALVMLISDSDAGFITYKAAVTFFPHNDPEDFAVSYDAYFEKELYSGKGRRSKKREKTLLEALPGQIEELAAKHGGTVFFEEPLREARLG